jgi:hypothetical protein
MPSDILTPMPDDQIGRLALIEAMRANTDALQRVGRQVEGQEKKFDEIGKTLGEMKTDIALLKNNALKEQVERNRSDIEKLTARMDAQSTLEAERKGERGVVSAIFNSKGLAWLVTGAAVLAAWIKGAFQ